MTNNYVYTLIRKDIPVNHQIVQACHSAHEAGSEFKAPGNIPNLVLLEVADEDHLDQMSQRLYDRGIRFHKFYEPDNDMGHTSLTTEVISGDKRKAFSNLRLWRSEHAAA